MAEHDALDAALALFKDPVSARRVPHITLPQGVDLVLAVAVGDEEALAAAGRRSGMGRDTLQQAAGFFIEQALLFRDADSYRVLGAARGAGHDELRHNMALLMRWLHPDLQSLRSGPLDREVFAARISRAWEDLKTEERRGAYDLRNPPAAPARAKAGGSRREGRSNGAAPPPSPARTSPRPRGAAKPAAATMAGSGTAKSRRPGNGAMPYRRPAPLAVSRIEEPSFWVRLWGFLWRPR